MNTSARLAELDEELRALKSAFAQTPYDLILYTYDLNIDVPYWFIHKTVILDTEDGSNAMATIEGANFDRMPYEGGAKFYLSTPASADNLMPIKLISMQKGTVTVYDEQ